MLTFGSEGVERSPGEHFWIPVDCWLHVAVPETQSWNVIYCYTLILREINFGQIEAPKTGILAFLKAALNIDFYGNFDVFKFPKWQFLTIWNQLNMISRKSQSDRKITKFPHWRDKQKKINGAQCGNLANFLPIKFSVKSFSCKFGVIRSTILAALKSLRLCNWEILPFQNCLKYIFGQFHEGENFNFN